MSSLNLYESTFIKSPTNLVRSLGSTPWRTASTLRILRSRLRCGTCPARFLTLSSRVCSTTGCWGCFRRCLASRWVSGSSMLLSSSAPSGTAGPRIRDTISAWTNNPRTSSDPRRTGLACRSPVCRLHRLVNFACWPSTSWSGSALYEAFSLALEHHHHRPLHRQPCTQLLNGRCHLLLFLGGRHGCSSCSRYWPQCLISSSTYARSELQSRQLTERLASSWQVYHLRSVDLCGSRLRYHDRCAHKATRCACTPLRSRGAARHTMSRDVRQWKANMVSVENEQDLTTVLNLCVSLTARTTQVLYRVTFAGTQFNPYNCWTSRCPFGLVLDGLREQSPVSYLFPEVIHPFAIQHPMRWLPILWNWEILMFASCTSN